MRIITGMYRGRTLKTVPDLSVRPATGRVRQTIFDMLVNRIDFDGLSVLDAFAGSGSLGFEALSRGARRTTFVEAESRAAEFIIENAQALGCTDDVEIVQMDAMAYFTATPGRYGLIFADPPYAFSGTASIPGSVFSASLLQPGGYLVIEHSPAVLFAEGPGYVRGPSKKFGRTIVTFFHNREDGR